MAITPDMRQKILIGLGVVAFVGLAWVGNFYFHYLQGIWPALRPAPSDLVDTLPSVTPVLSGGQSVAPLPSPNIPLKLPPGFSIALFAKDLPNARVIVFDGFGNAWVSQPSQGTVSTLEIQNGVVTHQHVVFKGLNKPHGLAFDPQDKNILYIAEESRIVRAHLYSDAPLEKIVDLPTGGNHFTRTIEFGPDGRLYIAVGSTCNVCNETDWRRAKILVMNKDGSGLKEYAKGLRNSVFFQWNPDTKEMWATEMGRDLLGDNIPPDEINIIREGQNYGWPNCYGQNIHDDSFDKNTYIRNPCQEPFEQPSKIDLQAHSAPLGLAFIPANNWPAEYRKGLLTAFHGSWNRSTPTGYKVVWFSKSADQYIQHDFITGWFPPGGKSTSAALGRPVDLVFGPGGALYITDDKAGVVYRVVYSPATPQPTVRCTPRPACLDAKPRCLPPEPAEGWCPTPSPIVGSC